MTLATLYPPAVQRPVSYAPAAGLLDQTPRGWVLHVVVGYGSPWGTFERAPSGSRRFSHLWVGRDGRVEQYTTLDRKSWAQAAGNPWWWSVETEGLPGEPLTEQQLDALAAWHVWCGAVDRIAGPEDTTGGAPGRGIVTHEDGGAAWGNHTCPGPIRAGQRAEILRRAALLRGGPTVTPAEISAVADAVLARLLAYAPPTGATGSDGKPLTLPWVLARDYQSLGRIEAAVTALQASVTSLQAAVAALTPPPKA